MGSLDPFSVDEGSISRAEVLDPPNVVFAIDFGMFAAGPLVRDGDRVRGSAADDQSDPFFQTKNVRPAISLANNQIS
jgi:hypothetical protein